MPRPSRLAIAADATLLLTSCAARSVLQRQAEGGGRIVATDGVNLAEITVPESSTPADAAAFLGAVLRAAGG